MNIALQISYHGGRYHGYQIQPNLVTVEGTLKHAIDRTFLEDIKIFSGGRTDRGVHAQGQVVNFHIEDTTIDIGNLPKVINYHLPPDISVIGAKYVDEDFHARFSAQGKWYRYMIDHHKYPNALFSDRSFHFPYPLNLQAMEEAFSYVIGEHDFKSFMGRHAVVKDTIRRIDSIELKEQDNFIFIDFKAKSFLKNMVRILVGTAVEVGRGYKEPYYMKEVLEYGHRKVAGPTAPAEGLYLMEIYYEGKA